MKPARSAALVALGFLAACSSSAPIRTDGGAHPDAPVDLAGSAGGTGGTTGTSGIGGSAAAGTTGGAGGAAGAHADAGVSDAKQKVIEFGAPANQDVDLLFMIDDSTSMQPLQQKLISSFPTFIDALKALPGGLPNLHIAIVSSSLGAGRTTTIFNCPLGGDAGIFHAKPLGATCAKASLDPGQSFIVTNGPAGANFTGDISDMFACIAPLGSNGCGFEHQLASVERALGVDGAPAPVQNAGFLRASAFLQVVLLTNEDDCSAPPNSDLFDETSSMVSDPLGPLQSYRCNEFGHLCAGKAPPRTMAADLSGTCVSNENGPLLPVAGVAAALKGLKTSSDHILVSAIAGPPSPYIVELVPSQIQGDPVEWPNVEHSCTSTDGTYADPSVRLKQWTDAFGATGLFASICADNLEQPVRAVAAQLETSMSGLHCLDASIAASQCTFVDHVLGADGGVRDLPLRSCVATAGVAPCWTLSSAANCPTVHLVQFLRAAGQTLSSTTGTCPIGP